MLVPFLVLVQKSLGTAGEDRVHKRQYRARRTIRQRQKLIAPLRVNILGAGTGRVQKSSEAREVGAAKRINGLLAVADHKQSARRAVSVFVGALAGVEVFNERSYQTPLVGTRVLRLVNQNMVEAAVQFPAHPVAVTQKNARQADEVVVVQASLGAFRLLVGGADAPRQHRQRC